MIEDREKKLSVGKLPPAELEAQILRYRGAHRPEVLVGPGIGEDAALIDWPNGKFLTVSSDPIIGASQDAGRYLVHVNANDIACKGGDPAYIVVTLIIPVQNGKGYAEQIMSEVHGECKKIGVAIVGGHTEITDRYDKPVIMGTMIGTTDYNYRADSLVPGDRLIVTKHIGIEGMAILAHDRPDLLSFMSSDEIKEVKSWLSRISVLPDSTSIRHIARFMHDPTEGGFLGGVSELSRLGRTGIEIDFDSVPLHPLTRRASEKLRFDPLKMISSGVLLAVVPEESEPEALALLKAEGIEAVVAGKVVEGSGNLNLSTDEELWRVLDMKAGEVLR